MAGRENLTLQAERIRVKQRIRIRRKRRKGRWLAFAGAAVLVIAGLLALGYLPARSARAHLLDARKQLERGQRAVMGNRVPEAVRQFKLAQASSIEASAAARNPLLTAMGWIPLLGRTPDTIVALADGGELVAQASVGVAEALEQLPGGVSSLAPKSGRVPLEPLTRLAPAFSEASVLVHGAHLHLAETAEGMLPKAVANARHEGLAQLSSLDRRLSMTAALLNRLPVFLGKNRPMRYFFGAQSPAELRGTGGLIGAYSTLTVHKGGLRFSPFHPIDDLPTFNFDEIKPPNADYGRNYNQFGGAGFWLNINMTPDFPTAAQAILNLYEKGTGSRLDGVILADPFALESLLKVTGAVKVPQYNLTVDANNVVPYTANEAYGAFKNQETRKLVLGEVAKAVFNEFMRRPGSPTQSLRALLEPVGSGHLLVYSNDRALEKALVASGEAGALPSDTGDFLSVIQNNGSGSKIDFYQDRRINYDVRLGPEGTALGSATVHLINNAPSRGLVPYIIGPYTGVSRAGENVAFVNLFCDTSCELRDFRRNGDSQLVVAGQERGYRFFQDYLKIPSRERAELRFDLANARAWEGSHTGGAYRLTFRNQPTIRPTKVRIEVQAPQGMKVYFTNVPMKVSGGTAVWEGTPGARLELEVRFQPPFVRRIWNSFTDFLSKPVF